MKDILKKMSNLINVKTIVTLLLTIVFCILALKSIINGEQFLVIFTTVILTKMNNTVKKLRNYKNTRRNIKNLLVLIFYKEGFLWKKKQ